MKTLLCVSARPEACKQLLQGPLGEGASSTRPSLRCLSPNRNCRLPVQSCLPPGLLWAGQDKREPWSNKVWGACSPQPP